MTSCPRCQAELRAGQDWCLECGAAARTRLARPPAWRLPVVAVAAIVAFAGLAASFAFVRLANTDPDVRAAQSATAATTATQPAAPPATTSTTAPQPSPFTTTTTTPTTP